MKKVFFLIIVSVTLFGNVFAANLSAWSTVKQIKTFSGRWANPNRGGFIVTLNTPTAGISYFIVRPTDVALELLMSQLLTARSKGYSVQIEYDITNTNEGDIVSLTMN